MSHIDLARWCDIVLVAPASANFIARLSHGQADDLLSTLCLVTDSPIMLAPAMNQKMWLNLATQDNVKTLKNRGILLLDPAEGDQACGETGVGRMLEPKILLQKLKQLFGNCLLADLRLLITAGPTRESIDPVRYISNHSSGRMGYAVAQAALEAGAQVTLIAGPVTLTAPSGTYHIGVQTAQQMYTAVMENIEGTDIFIATAAVADYRCTQVAEQKISKHTETFTLNLEKTPDIITEVANLRHPPFTVGFAAETENLADNAQAKLVNKNLDMIMANRVGENIGFNVEENTLQVFWSEGHQLLSKAPKDRLARQLIQIVADRYYEKHPDQIH